MPDLHPTLMLALLLSTGVFGFWLAERLDVPDILLSLGLGHILAVTLVNAQAVDNLRSQSYQLLGGCLAVLFFEGGRALARQPLGPSAGLVRHLASVGPKLGWVLASGAAGLCLGLTTERSLLLGALLMVSAPYLTEPLVRRLGGSPQLALVAHWESFTVSCVGTAWAILMAGALVAHTGHPSLWTTLETTSLTALVGLVCGLLGGWLLNRLINSGALGERLEDAASLCAVLMVFGCAHTLFWGGGLVASIVMGYRGARREPETVKKDFWGTARVLSLAMLSTSLGVLILPYRLVECGWRGMLLALLMLLVVRPLLVLVGARGAGVSRADKLVLALSGPHGVLTLSTAAMMARRLKDVNVDPGPLVGAVYWVVLVTTIVPWFLGPLLVRRLRKD